MVSPTTFKMNTLSKNQMSYIVSGISVFLIAIIAMEWFGFADFSKNLKEIQPFV